MGEVDHGAAMQWVISALAPKMRRLQKLVGSSVVEAPHRWDAIFSTSDVLLALLGDAQKHMEDLPEHMTTLQVPSSVADRAHAMAAAAALQINAARASGDNVVSPHQAVRVLGLTGPQRRQAKATAMESDVARHEGFDKGPDSLPVAITERKQAERLRRSRKTELRMAGIAAAACEVPEPKPFIRQRRPVTEYMPIRMPVPRGALSFGPRYGPALVLAASHTAMPEMPRGAKYVDELEKELKASDRDERAHFNTAASTDPWTSLSELCRASFISVNPGTHINVLPIVSRYIVVPVHKYITIELPTEREPVPTQEFAPTSSGAMAGAVVPCNISSCADERKPAPKLQDVDAFTRCPGGHEMREITDYSGEATASPGAATASQDDLGEATASHGCADERRPAPTLQDVDAFTRCPGGHEMREITDYSDTYECDVCRQSIQGEFMYCEQCDFARCCVCLDALIEDVEARISDADTETSNTGTDEQASSLPDNIDDVESGIVDDETETFDMGTEEQPTYVAASAQSAPASRERAIADMVQALRATYVPRSPEP